LVETLAQTAQAYALFGPQLLGQLTGFTKAHNARDVERARTDPALVPTTIEQGPYADTPGTRFADIERPHTLRAVELMARERHEIHVQVIDITGDFPYALHRIAVEQHPVFVGNGTNGRQWPHGADFAIHVHDGDKSSVRGNGPANVIRIDQPHAIDRHIRHV